MTVEQFMVLHVTIPHTKYGLMATHVNELNNPDGRWVGAAAAAFLALARLLLLGLGAEIDVVGGGTTLGDKPGGVGGDSALVVVDVVVSLVVLVVVIPRDGGNTSERPEDRR
jgi:hypothetical protein